MYYYQYLFNIKKSRNYHYLQIKTNYHLYYIIVLYLIVNLKFYKCFHYFHNYFFIDSLCYTSLFLEYNIIQIYKTYNILIFS